MSSVVISGDTSGAITLAAPAVSGTNTATLPAATGTVMVSGNMPAFSAYQSTGQTFTGSTFTKVQLQAETFDTANAFDSTTNYRFTPQVAGYYYFTGQAYTASSVAKFQATFYKNGSAYQYGPFMAQMSQSSALIYLNGSTDYVELYVYADIGTASTPTSLQTYLQGSLVRTA